jgi:hypothetical protein
MKKQSTPAMVASYGAKRGVKPTDEAAIKAAVYRDTEMPPRSLLQQAHDTINGQRQQDYGDKLQNFAQTAMIWEGILAPKLAKYQHITAEDVALLMIGLKMSRLSKTPTHKDSILDIAGYAGCMDILQTERKEGTELLGATVDLNC